MTMNSGYDALACAYNLLLSSLTLFHSMASGNSSMRSSVVASDWSMPIVRS